MIVGEAESKSLFSDIIRLPLMVFQFCAFIPNEISAMMRREAFLSAVLSVAGFGVFAQMIVWAVTNKASWTYNNGRELPFLKFWGIDGIILLILAVALSSIVFRRQSRHESIQP
jgi:hypothetical protein